MFEEKATVDIKSITGFVTIVAISSLSTGR